MVHAKNVNSEMTLNLNHSVEFVCRSYRLLLLIQLMVGNKYELRGGGSHVSCQQYGRFLGLTNITNKQKFVCQFCLLVMLVLLVLLVLLETNKTNKIKQIFCCFLLVLLETETKQNLLSLLLFLLILLVTNKFNKILICWFSFLVVFVSFVRD